MPPSERALEPGGTVVESTSGNTGIGLAAVSAARGYDCVLTMPSSMSTERRQLFGALGAELELTPAEDGMTGANERAEQLVATREDAIIARQFENEANPAAHRKTTGPEIWDATDGAVDAVVAGVGTGGTITGVSEFVKEAQGKTRGHVGRGRTRRVADPLGMQYQGHEIQGIGPGFVPDILRTDLIDEVRAVEAADAKAAARKLGRTDGLLVGISSGAALAAAAEYASDPDELVVVVLPDTGERYLSTDLYDSVTDEY